jgi:hypothetical protein
MIPTEYIHYDYRLNLICDPDNPVLVQKASKDRFSSPSHWRAGYGGEAYLGRPNSEDALTWNVFRSLQVAGHGGLEVLGSILGTKSPVKSVLFWGCDVEGCSENQQLLNILIRTTDGLLPGTLPEPDLVFITAEEVYFCECILNQSGTTSPWKAQGDGAAKRMDVYCRDLAYLSTISNWEPLYQLIRQQVYAQKMAVALGKKPKVLPIVNGNHFRVLQRYYSALLEAPSNGDGTFLPMVTWQEVADRLAQSAIERRDAILAKIYEALPASP